jgi:hypothetical protein
MHGSSHFTFQYCCLLLRSIAWVSWRVGAMEARKRARATSACAEAIAPLRDEGVLIVGSGLTYHSKSGFGRASSTPAAEAFDASRRRRHPSGSGVRTQLLVNWDAARAARRADSARTTCCPSCRRQVPRARTVAGGCSWTTRWLRTNSLRTRRTPSARPGASLSRHHAARQAAVVSQFG